MNDSWPTWKQNQRVNNSWPTWKAYRERFMTNLKTKSKCKRFTGNLKTNAWTIDANLRIKAWTTHGQLVCGRSRYTRGPKSPPKSGNAAGGMRGAPRRVSWMSRRRRRRRRRWRTGGEASVEAAVIQVSGFIELRGRSTTQRRRRRRRRNLEGNGRLPNYINQFRRCAVPARYAVVQVLRLEKHRATILVHVKRWWRNNKSLWVEKHLRNVSSISSDFSVLLLLLIYFFSESSTLVIQTPRSESVNTELALFLGKFYIHNCIYVCS